MSLPLARLALVATTALGALAAGAVTAPAAHAQGGEQPPGFARMPAQSKAVLKAAPLTVPHGRKLR